MQATNANENGKDNPPQDHTRQAPTDQVHGGEEWPKSRSDKHVRYKSPWEAV